MTVINFLKAKVNTKEFNNYEELQSIINSIPEDDEYTSAAIEYIGDTSHLHVFFNVEKPATELNSLEVGLLNYLASITFDIRQLRIKLEEAIPPALYSGIEGSIELLRQDKVIEAAQGMDMYSVFVTEEITDIINRIKKLTILYQAVRLKYLVSIQERVGFVKFSVIGKNVFLTKPAHSIISYNTL